MPLSYPHAHPPSRIRFWRLLFFLPSEAERCGEPFIRSRRALERRFLSPRPQQAAAQCLPQWTHGGALKAAEVASFYFLAAFFSSSLFCPSPPLIKRPLKKRAPLTVVVSSNESDGGGSTPPTAFGGFFTTCSCRPAVFFLPAFLF